MLCRLRPPFLSHSLLWRTHSLSTLSTGGTPPSYQPSSHVISETEAFNNEMAAVFGGAPSTSTMDNDSRGEQQQQEHQMYSPSTVSSQQQQQQPPPHIPGTPGTPVTITVPSVGDGQAVNIHLHFHSSVGNITVNYSKR